jgi:hypothetical protein
MATLATPPVMQPVNRLLDVWPPPDKQLSRPTRAPPEPKRLHPRAEKSDLAAAAWLVVAPLALGVVVLWPMLFVALVLLLVVVSPLVAVSAGIRAILRHKGRVVGCPSSQAGLEDPIDSHQGKNEFRAGFAARKTWKGDDFPRRSRTAQLAAGRTRNP